MVLSLGSFPLILAQSIRNRQAQTPVSLERWIAQPSGSVFLVLVLAIVVGGGLQGMRLLRSRRSVERISGDSPELEAIQEAATCGRAGLVDLFRLLEHPTSPEIRNAAGRALCRLWKADELVAEEEVAILVRGRNVIWKARRKYPRSMNTPITITVDFGPSFLEDSEDSIRPENLLWSYRIAGTGQVSTEQYSPWQSGATRAMIGVDPRHFPSNGPHRLVLHVRAKTHKLTSEWEKELPQVPFTFEFDSNLQMVSLLSTADDARRQVFRHSLSLVMPSTGADTPSFRPITAAFAIGGPLQIVGQGELPCDLAHRVEVEIEGLSGRISSSLIVATSGAGFPTQELRISSLETSEEMPDNPSRARIRAILTPDLGLAWSSPDTRSVWPEPIETAWIEVPLYRI